MTTELLEKPTVTKPAEITDETPTDQESLRAELAELLRFKRKHVPKEGLTPCPACTTQVRVSANDCPHCNSYIAAHNALVRENLRRLEEIEAQLDAERNELVDSHRQADNLSLWSRIRSWFAGAPSESVIPISPILEEEGPRFLDRVREGDQLIILARVGSWYHVKTRDSKTGWLYSTFVEEG